MPGLSAPLQVDAGLRAAAREVFADFDELLDTLAAAPVFRCGEGSAPPRSPGVYVFSEHGVARHVGRTGDLQRRRQEQTGLSNDRNAATFAFRAAVEEAHARHPELRTLSRVELERHPDFTPYFSAWKERVRRMDMRCIEIDSPSKRHVFETMASLALGLPEHLWNEH